MNARLPRSFSAPFPPALLPTPAASSMEASEEQLLGDSFSYRWLINAESCASLGDSHRSFDAPDGGGCSFIEIDPGFISMRWTSDAINSFGFVLPTSTQRPAPQVHADKIFSNGLLLPLHVPGPPETLVARRSSLSRPRCAVREGANTSPTSSPLFHTASSSPNWMSSSCSSPYNNNQASSRGGKLSSRLVRNCAKSPKKILCEYFCFLLPLYKMVKDFRLTSSKSTSSCKYSARSSPRTSSALSGIEWCRSNADISIYDAILHCKKSIVSSKSPCYKVLLTSFLSRRSLL
ncbi:unnamed protein product [Musa hybrid cultivar]